MRSIATRASITCISLLLASAPRLAVAQPAQPPPPASDPGAAAPANDLTPPVLQKRVEATYPDEAKQAGLEGNVGLALIIADDGHVIDAKVTSPAGHGFDEAALAAAKSFVFDPARENGKAIRSAVQFTYEFHLPPAPKPETITPPVVVPPPPPTAGEVRQAGPDQSSLVLASRPTSAASSSAVRDREFQLRPIGSVQDILRVTPGLVMVQHSGGGKANQYFLRGFDADHGTDLALSIDGVPINLVSHAHGQGFSDTNFIIPEVVERVEITKGPYFANQGDFATAGAVNMVTRDGFEHSSIGLATGGSPGHGAPGYRGLLIASPKLTDNLTTTFAADIGRQNGPFDNPENWDKYKLFSKITYALSDHQSFSLGEMSYGSAWHGSGQIPARAVEEGLISRFGSIDPDEGGYTQRHQVYLQYKNRINDNSELKGLAYLGSYNFNLFSNFTLYEVDQENGDEIEQIDRRTFYGGKLSYRVVHDIQGVRFDTTIGGDTRSDDIHEELWHTVHRDQLSQIRGNNVHETFIGAYASEEITPFPWIRGNVALRADNLAFAVDNTYTPANDPTAPKSGIDNAHQLSPKANLVVTPLDRPDAQLDLYVNWGNGFHSNDVRGAFAEPAVTPLTRAIGSEVGARTRLWDRLDFAAAFWQLDLRNETTWDGDNGTTDVAGATNRHGIELEGRYEILKWLSVDGDVTFTHSQFSTDNENGGGLALAPKQTYSGGISARHPIGPGIARGGLRFYGITDRPASDDGVLVAPGFTLVDLHLGYRTRRWDLAFDVENLLNSNSRSAQFATVGRLRNEPAIGAPIPAGFSCGSNGRLATDPAIPANRFAGCEDVHFTPNYPTTLRVMGTLFLD